MFQRNIIEENIPDKKLIEDWLTDIRGNKVHIHIPKKELN